MKIKECPYCGCNEFYTKERASGAMQVRHSFDGDGFSSDEEKQIVDGSL